MTTAVSLSLPVQSHCIPCEWVDNLCKAVYEIAMKVFRAISECFSSVSHEITTLAPSRVGVTVDGPRNVVAFYQGLEPNIDGRTLNQILSWNDGQLEAVHNYIQWLFPLTTPTGNNPTAPILDRRTILAFRGDATIKNNMLHAFRRMLSFYGLQMDETTRVITRAPNFNARIAVWLLNPAGHHNFLRMSRIIQSLHLLGLPEYGTAFFNILADIYRYEGGMIIPRDTYENHWVRAEQRGYV